MGGQPLRRQETPPDAQAMPGHARPGNPKTFKTILFLESLLTHGGAPALTLDA